MKAKSTICIGSICSLMTLSKATVKITSLIFALALIGTFGYLFISNVSNKVSGDSYNDINVSDIVKRNIVSQTLNYNVYNDKSIEFVNNYFNGTSYVPINTAVTTSSYSNYEYEVTKNVYKTYFQDNINSGEAVRFEKDGYYFIYDLSGGKIQWAEQLGNPIKIKSIGAILSSSIILAGDKVYYNGAFAYTNVSYFILDDMLKENFILSSSLPIDDTYLYLEYTGEVKHSNNLMIYANGENQTGKNFITQDKIEFKDVNGTTIFFLPAPTVTDSNGSSDLGFYDIKISSGKIAFNLRVNSTFLKNAAYPVYIDPTITYTSSGAVCGDVYERSTGSFYSNITVNPGVTLTVCGWGTPLNCTMKVTGDSSYVASGCGYVNFTTSANGVINVYGKIDGNGLGYIGGAGQPCTTPPNYGYQGESYVGVGSKAGANNAGGGGGGGDGSGGGGGGYGGTGGAGNVPGTGGAVYGGNNLTSFMGSGGGGSCFSSGNYFTGGSGGGLIKFNTTTLKVTGTIEVMGGKGGGNLISGAPATAGGSGGEILLFSKNINITNAILNASGGNGGDRWQSGLQGAGGGGGRIKLFYSNVTGNSSAFYNVSGGIRGACGEGGCTPSANPGTAGIVYFELNSSYFTVNNFTSVWNTSKTGTSNSTQIKLPLYNGGSYAFTVDWGDGTTDYITSYLNDNHTYATSGIYVVNISGTINGFRFNNGGDRLKIINITQWGDLNVGNSNGYFLGCTNLNSNATDNLDLTGTTDLSYMFRAASSFNGNISNWNVGSVTDMSYMFYDAVSFNWNIESWSTGNVNTMYAMFDGASSFNQNMSNWNTGKVTTMYAMFWGASSFKGNVSGWDTSKVTTMSNMFYSANVFNQSLNSWNTNNVTTMLGMFQYAAAFNQSLSNWNTSKVTDMSYMFRGATTFNNNISSWDTSKVIDMSYMFYGDTAFNQNIGSWNTGNVTSMASLFNSVTNFNQNISGWNTSKVADMSYMFYIDIAFNQNLSNWDTSKVTTMSNMFRDAVAFNGNISSWNTNNVTNMNTMFRGDTAFNQNLGSWNTSKVNDMASMFQSAANFNQNISSWDTGKVTTMASMFLNAITFNQNLSTWNVSSLTVASNMFSGVTLSTANYDSLLIGWSSRVEKNATVFSGGNSKYSAAGLAGRNILTGVIGYNWTITDGGPVDVLNPTYTNFGSDYTNNTAVNGGSILTYYAKWIDNIQLDKCVNSSKINTSGSWTNGTWASAGTGNWTNYTVNFPSEAGSNYTVKIYCNDTSGNMNMTGTLFWWAESFVITQNHTWQGTTLEDDNTFAYSPTLNVSFQMTALNFDNGTFEFDGTNYTISTNPKVYNDTNGVYWINFTNKRPGNYDFKWYASTISGIWKNTSQVTLIVTKAYPAFSNSLTTPINYLTASDYASNGNNAGCDDCTYYTKRNGTQICVGACSDTTVLGASAYNYTIYTAGGENYTSGQSELDLTVNKIILSGTISSPDVTYPTGMSITGSESNTGDADVAYQTCLDNVCTLGKGPNTFNYGANTYTCKFNTTGATFENYTASASIAIDSCTINKGTSLSLSINSNVTSPITYPTPSSINGSGCVFGAGYGTDIVCTLYRGNSTWSGTGNDTAILGAGIYAYNYSTPGGTNWTATSASNYTLIVNRGSLSLSINSNVTSPITYPTPSSVNGSGCAGSDVVCTLYRGNSSWSGTGNDSAVLSAGVYAYNYSTPGGTNYSAASAANYTLVVLANTPPTYTNFGSTVSNNTVVIGGSAVTYYAKWSDDVQLDKCANSSRVNNSAWVNGTWVSPGTGNWTNYTVAFPSERGSNLTIRIYCNDSVGQMVETGTLFWIIDYYPYSNSTGQASNSIPSGTNNTLFSKLFAGGGGTTLNWAWLSTNETGSWKNYTIYNSTVNYLTANNVSQTIWNETFTWSQNKTFWLILPKGSYVSNAYLNLSGYGTLDINVVNTSAYTYFTSPTLPANRTYDNNTLTYAYLPYTCGFGGCQALAPGFLYYTFKNQSVNQNATTTFSCPGQNHQAYLYIWNFSSSSWEYYYLYSGGCGGSAATFYFNLTTNYVSNGVVNISWQLNATTEDAGGVSLYDIRGNNLTIGIENPYLDVSGDGDKDWSYIGIFNQSNNRTSNFASEVNSYLSTCTADVYGNCNVPMILHSDTAGIIQVSDINISYNNATYGSPMNLGGASNAWVNFTWQNNSIIAGNIIGWKIYFNDSLGHENVTETYNFTIESSKPIISQNHTWQGTTLEDDNTFTYSPTLNVSFQITAWAYDLNILTATFEFNGVNYTNSTTTRVYNNTNNVFWINFTSMKAGNYNFRWYVNDTVGGWSNTSQVVLAIGKATLVGTISSPDVYFPADMSLTGLESNAGDVDVAYQTCLGDACKPGLGPNLFGSCCEYPADTYTCKFNTTGAVFENYTSNANIATDSCTINKGGLVGTITSPDVTYPANLFLTGSESNVGDTDVTYQTCVSNICKAGLGANSFDIGGGTYNCIFNTTGATFANWTASASMQTDSCTVNKGILTGSSSSPAVTYPAGLTATGTETNTVDTDVAYREYCELGTKGVLMGSALGGNPSGTVVLDVGTWTCKLNTTGGPFANWTASASIGTSVGIVSIGTLIGTISSPDVTYPTDMTITGIETNTGDSDVAYRTCLSGSGECKSGKGPNTFDYPPGTYSCVFNTTGAAFANWTSSSNIATDVCVINNGTLTIQLSTPTPITYEAVAGIEGWITNNAGDGGCTYILLRNGTQINTSIHVTDNTILGAGYYNYTYYTAGCANYTINRLADVPLTVNQKNAFVRVYPWTGPITYETSVFQYCTSLSTLVNCTMYRNGTTVTNGTNIVLGVGAYLFKANISDAANYTNYDDLNILTVDKKQLAANLWINGHLNQNTTVVQTFPYIPKYATSNATNINGLSGSLYRDDAPVAGDTDTIPPVQGTYKYKANATGNVNYTSDSVGQTFYASVISAHNITISSPVNGSSIGILPNTNKSVQINYTVGNPVSIVCAYAIDAGINTSYRVNMLTCENVTSIGISQIGSHNLTVAVWDTFFTTYNESSVFFDIDFVNQWIVTNGGGVVLTDGNVSFSNGTYSFNLSTTNGTFSTNTSLLPKGNVSATFKDFVTYADKTVYYNVTNETQISTTIVLSFSGVTIRVFGEDSLSPINWYKVTMTNGTASTGAYTTQLTVGKGNPGGYLINFLDDDINTYESNLNALFTYEFGFTNATFALTYNISDAVGNSTNLTLKIYNNTVGAWDTVFNLTNSGNSGGITTRYFTIDNSPSIYANYGDIFTSCLGTYCPLFMMNMTPAGSAVIKVYEMRLTEPYTYDTNGFAQINFTKFPITSGTSRFMFQSPVYASSLNNYGLRTYFINPSAMATINLDAYLSNLCYIQQFQTVQSSLATTNPIPVPDVLLTLMKVFGTELKIVDQQKSDYSGIARLCVEAGYPYTMTFVKSGYQTQTAYDEVFSNAGPYYVNMFTVNASDYFSNPYSTNISITPADNYIHNSTTIYTCAVLAPYNPWGPSGNVLLSSFLRIYHSYEFAAYPPNISSALYPPSSGFCNGTAPFCTNYYTNTTCAAVVGCNWVNWIVTGACNGPPTCLSHLKESTCLNETGCDWTRFGPFGISTLHNSTLVSNQTSTNPLGAIFTYGLNESGTYNITCGGYFRVVNDTSIFNATGSIIEISKQRVIWVEPTGGGIAGAGKDLIGNISESALYFVVLILDMIITSFFVRHFGMKSAFIFLVVWAMAMVILGGWGFNAQTGVFSVGFLLWIALMFYPYRRE